MVNNHTFEVESSYLNQYGEEGISPDPGLLCIPCPEQLGWPIAAEGLQLSEEDAIKNITEGSGGNTWMRTLGSSVLISIDLERTEIR